MDLASMRSLFYKHTSSLSTEVSENEVDAYLNRSYQYTVPLEVGGEFSEQIWQLLTLEGIVEYDLPAPIVSMSGKEPWINSYFSRLDPVGFFDTSITYVNLETDPVVFERKYLSRSNNSRPTAALFYGKKITISAEPGPDIQYQLNIPVRSGSLLALTFAGIEHDTHALAVVTGATVEYLSEIETMDDPGVQREINLHASYVNLLQTYALSRPMQRRYTRSF